MVVAGLVMMDLASFDPVQSQETVVPVHEGFGNSWAEGRMVHLLQEGFAICLDSFRREEGHSFPATEM
jgi:hypothetical protein